MADVNVTVVVEEVLHFTITEAQPMNITIEGGGSSLLDDIFDPDESGYRITKMYIKNGKLKIKYESGE